MFRNIKRRDNRKQRLSSWFACERDGDMQAFDFHGVASGVGLYFHALLRERTLRRAIRAAAGNA